MFNLRTFSFRLLHLNAVRWSSTTPPLRSSPTRLVQFESLSLGTRVGIVSPVDSNLLIDLTAIDPSVRTVYELFFKAYQQGLTINGILQLWKDQNKLFKARVEDYAELLRTRNGRGGGWLLPPLTHPTESAKCLVTGTGLTHLGSMEARDQMHTKMSISEKDKTDSQKMFELGLVGGKPASDSMRRGAQPEWFYKGDGSILRAHNDDLEIPSFTIDGGEEPEIAGCYIVDPTGTPHRIGFTICNEWSDHEMEKVNYLWLAPSKLRCCAMGPELVMLERFDALQGFARIYRPSEEEGGREKVMYDSGVLWTGEEHMSHSLLNIEDHQFKYDQFRQPGFVHLHSFGTSKLSFPNRDRFRTGDKIEMGFQQMGPPLVNYIIKKTFQDKPSRVKAVQHLLKYE